MKPLEQRLRAALGVGEAPSMIVRCREVRVADVLKAVEPEPEQWLWDVHFYCRETGAYFHTARVTATSEHGARRAADAASPNVRIEGSEWRARRVRRLY